MIPHFVSSLIVQQKYLSSLCHDIMFYEDIKKSGASFLFLLSGTRWGSFPFPPTSLKHELYGLTSSFTRLIIKIKYVYHGLISLHVIFYDNRTK